mgnify:CR=1 FL=1
MRGNTVVDDLLKALRLHSGVAGRVRRPLHAQRRQRLKEAERKLKHTSRHVANYPTVNEFAATIAAEGALCKAYEDLLGLPAELLERSPKRVEIERGIGG